MRALHFDGRAAQVREGIDAPRPRPPRDDSVIRLLLGGICNTDLELARGYMDFRGTPGHEFVGIVEDSADPALVGRRVVGRINVGCLRCDACRAGLENHCPRRTVLGILGRDGAFQERFLLPKENLVPVPDAVSDAAAVFAEPLAAACRVLQQVDVRRGRRAAVLGDGKLGLLIAWVLADAGADVTLFGRRPGRVGDERFAHVHADGDAPTPARFPVVVEATGSETGLAAALRRVEPLGTIVLKTTCAAPHRLGLAPVVIDEVTIVGSRCGPLDHAVALLPRAESFLHRMVDASYPLARAPDALAHAARPGALKVLLEGDVRT